MPPNFFLTNPISGFDIKIFLTIAEAAQNPKKSKMIPEKVP